MEKTLTVLFDGQVLRPESPLELEPNKRYIIKIEVPDVVETENAWDVLSNLAGTIEGPEDWASEHDHYLYGTPKRRDKPSDSTTGFKANSIRLGG